MDSILTTIKKMLGLTEPDDSFDTDIIIGVNTAFAALTQIGIGPVDGFVITDKSEEWSKFIGDSKYFEAVKSFVYLKVKLLFDPPANSALLESINNTIDELTFRLYVQSETVNI